MKLKNVFALSLGLATICSVLPGCSSKVETDAAANIVIGGQEVEDYLHNMNFDENKVTAQKIGDELYIDPDKKSKSSTEEEDLGDTLIYTHKQVKDVMSGNGDITNIIDASTNVYPGSIVKCDDQLIGGSPTSDGLSRGSVRVNLDLNGAQGDEKTFTATAVQGEVESGVNNCVEKWFKRGYDLGANWTMGVTQARSSNQLNATFGMSNIANKLGIKLEPKYCEEENYFVITFKQVYYTASVDINYNESKLYADDVTLDKIKAQYPLNENGICNTPPVLIDKVNYGRMIYFTVKTRKKEAEVSAAFKYVFQENKEKDAEKKKAKELEIGTKFKSMCETFDMTYTVYGGPSQTSGGFISADEKGAALIRETIEKGKNLKSFAQGAPKIIGFSSMFLKNNRRATTRATSSYIEKTVQILKEQQLTCMLKGCYVISEWNIFGYKIIGLDEKGNPKFSNVREGLFHRTGVLARQKFIYKIPVRYGRIEIHYNIMAGRSWPFRGRISGSDFFKEAEVYMHGGSFTPRTEIIVDGNRRIV